MIFDSTVAQEVMARYAALSDRRVPKIVFLGRADEMQAERAYLDDLVSAAPSTKHKDWVGRLLSDSDEQHMGAWFEIMLYGWLRTIGEVVVEPNVEGNAPDFAVNLNGQEVIVEARAVLMDNAEQLHQKDMGEIMWTLQQIPQPYFVTIKQMEFAGSIRPEHFMNVVTRWLESGAAEPLLYRDDQGNQIKLSAIFAPGYEHVGTMGPVTVEWINPEPLKKPLKKKANQHRALRAAGHPYVLAMLLESVRYSADDIAAAWFGKSQIIVDVDSKRVVEERVDRTGLHFVGRDILYTTVSGTLVFRKQWSDLLGRHELRAWYIQNPFAAAPIVVSYLPVESSFIVLDRPPSGVSMGWRPNIE